VKESDIRPSDILNRYLELCNEDSTIYFKGCVRQDIPCPACDSKQIKHSFNKWGFDYVVCQECGTLYQSPRPPQEIFSRFYQESRSAEYWAKTFFPTVAEARREHLFCPKVQQIAQLCEQDDFYPAVIADVGAGYGLFLEEWGKTYPESELIAIEPNPDLAQICRSKKLKVVESFIEETNHLYGKTDMVVALELIEHVHDPYKFCSSLKRLLQDGGRLLLTGLTVDGFDIQTLWEHSKSVSPPHHINFMSILGFEQLLTRVGFSNIRIFTPGKLDVDIVKNFVAEKPDILMGQRFIKNLLERSEETLKDFQMFLSDHLFSSHCWIWAEK
jgi:SAM-dependent methyltransferase